MKVDPPGIYDLEGTEMTETTKRIFKQARRSACQELIKHLEEKASQRSLKDAGSDFGIQFALEQAKNFLKTLS